jgi:hypothetical protein
MQIFFKQSISQFENINGKKKASFEIIKGKDGLVHQIKGSTSNENKDTFDIQERIIKKNSNNGFIKNKQKTYKIKASDLNNILLESEKSIDNNTLINNKSKIIKNKNKIIKKTDTKTDSKKISTKTDSSKKISTKKDTIKIDTKKDTIKIDTKKDTKNKKNIEKNIIKDKSIKKNKSRKDKKHKIKKDSVKNRKLRTKKEIHITEK